MENYGLTVRQIRLNKGFKQKEIYTGLLSKSFSIDFEKGLYAKHIKTINDFNR